MRSELVIVGLVGAVVLLALVGALAWWLMSYVPPNAARLWALTATLALPLVAWAAWGFGHTEARGRLAGIDQAVDKVMGAATKAAGLNVSTARAMRQPAQEPYTVILPDVEIIPRQLTSGRNVVEL